MLRIIIYSNWMSIALKILKKTRKKDHVVKKKKENTENKEKENKEKENKETENKEKENKEKENKEKEKDKTDISYEEYLKML